MYQTDWAPRRRRRGRRRARRTGRTVSLLLAVSAAAAGAVAVVSTGQPATTPVPVTANAARPQTPSASRSATPVPKLTPKATRVPSASPTRKRQPEPVTGLNQAQMNNAAVIVQVARDRGLPRRAMLVAMITGMQESSLRNLANTTVPLSLDRPNEGTGENFDSLGVFQQRPSQGWGSVAELMNPRYAAGAFYERLLKVDDWETRSLGDAAQAVQRSAVPDAYAEHENRAEKIVDALL
ncbi:hypothetical protein [Actinoplanes subglobosus]|uniref:Peptidase M23 n=1 Tax=Actinoplanes subglobosus TaxID=1547892 RepID=A0ABV8J5F2_9ACTN